MEMVNSYSIALIAGFLFIYYFIFRKKEPKNFPPGPRSYIPLIGGLAQTGKEPGKYFQKLREKWGDIFAFDLGPNRVITVNGYKAIQEMTAQPELSGKDMSEPVCMRMADNVPHGILFNDGPVWAEQRKFTLKTLRDFGFGKKTIESQLEIETKDLIEGFRKYEGKPVLIEHHFTGAVINTLWALVSGQRHEQDDPILHGLFKRENEDVESLGILYFYPWVIKLTWIKSIQRYIDNSKYMMAFMKDTVDQHKRTYQEGSERDLIDKYLTEINRVKDPNSSFYGKEGEKNLTTILNDFFMAGAETTSTYLSWAVHIMSLHPVIQEKFHNEIKSVVGLSRYPALVDRNSMPYTEALLMEVFRYSVVVAMIPHQVLKDTEFRGFFFPKGTNVFINLYSTLKDPKVWDNPEEFRVERFLSPDGKQFVKNEALMPFSTGKRQCLGKSLAIDEIFLFMTAIIQRFKISPHGTPPKEIQYNPGGTNIPISFPLIFKDRFE